MAAAFLQDASLDQDISLDQDMRSGMAVPPARSARAFDETLQGWLIYRHQ
jgi:hypothetical protein